MDEPLQAGGSRLVGSSRPWADERSPRAPSYLTGGATAVLHGLRLAKISRDFELDRADVKAMIDQGLVDPKRLEELFERIAPDLFRYPSLDAADFRAKLERTLGR